MLNVSWAKKRAEFIFVFFSREREMMMMMMRGKRKRKAVETDKRQDGCREAEEDG